MVEEKEKLIRHLDHTYWIGAEELWGVTAVLKDNRLVDDQWFTETHSSRGIAVHAEMANAARGLPEFAFLDPDLYGWCKSGRDFLEMLRADGAEILGVESRRFHPLYRFAGELDLHVRWRGHEWVLDFKTGKAAKAARFQTAAYDLLLGPTPDGKPRKRAAVELQEDGGRARLVEFNGPGYYHDGNTFLALLAASRARELCGIKE